MQIYQQISASYFAFKSRLRTAFHVGQLAATQRDFHCSYENLVLTILTCC